MATLHNEILVNASVDKLWSMLTDLELLEKYDPTVKKSTLVSKEKTGIGAKEKVQMLDGKNWFDEKVTQFNPNESLTYQLTECSFQSKDFDTVTALRKIGNQTKVKQVMQYTVKFGLLGKLLDAMMIRRQSDAGIKKFLPDLNLMRNLINLTI